MLGVAAVFVQGMCPPWQALVLLVRGPANCVEVAAEALRKLGRMETVRDALSFVKTTSPHRRLTQERRLEQQQQQQQQKQPRQQQQQPRQQQKQVHTLVPGLNRDTKAKETPRV